MYHKRLEQLQNEISYIASRSQGPGGQHVNKVNTRIELRFNVAESNVLTDSEKVKITEVFRNKISSDGNLIIAEQGSRSQLQNRQTATLRFLTMIEAALKPVKKRRPTRPNRASIERRLEKKRRHAQKKRLRGKEDY